MVDRSVLQLLRLGMRRTCWRVPIRGLGTRRASPATAAKASVLDEALAEWAESYGDQTERDHAALVAAIKAGEIKAQIEADDVS